MPAFIAICCRATPLLLHRTGSTFRLEKAVSYLQLGFVYMYF